MTDSRTLFKNSIYNVVYKLLDALFPLISATYTARVLLAGGVGKVSYAQNIAQYFVLIASLGIPSYGIREVARRRQDKNQTSKVFSELFMINLLSTATCVLVYYALVFRLPYFQTRREISLVAGLLILFNAFNVEWFYQGQEAFRYIAIRSFVIKLLSLCALFLLVRTEADYIRYMLVICLTTGINYMINMLQLRRFGIRIQLHKLNLRPHMKPILILLGTTVAIELYTMLDTTMLGVMCADENVGYYTNAMKLVKIVIMVITAIGGVLLPHLSTYYMQGDYKACSEIVKKVFQVMFFLFLPCCVGLLLTSDILMVALFGESFAPAGETLRIASLLTLALGFSNLFGTQVLLTFGEEKKLLLCTIAGAVSNVLMNLYFIPVYQQNGAAIASVISEALVTALSVIFAGKYITIRADKDIILKTTISTAVMGIVVWAVMQIKLGIYVRLAVAVLVGVGVYFSVNLALRNCMLKELGKFVKRG